MCETVCTPSLSIAEFKIWQINTQNYYATPNIFSGNTIEPTGEQSIHKVFGVGSIIDPDDEPPGAFGVRIGTDGRACIYLEFDHIMAIYAVVLIM